MPTLVFTIGAATCHHYTKGEEEGKDDDCGVEEGKEECGRQKKAKKKSRGGEAIAVATSLLTTLTLVIHLSRFYVGPEIVLVLVFLFCGIIASLSVYTDVHCAPLLGLPFLVGSLFLLTVSASNCAYLVRTGTSTKEKGETCFKLPLLACGREPLVFVYNSSSISVPAFRLTSPYCLAANSTIATTKFTAAIWCDGFLLGAKGSVQQGFTYEFKSTPLFLLLVFAFVPCTFFGVLARAFAKQDTEAK